MENNFLRGQSRVLEALTIMIQVIAYELRVVEVDFSGLYVGVDLELS